MFLWQSESVSTVVAFEFRWRTPALGVFQFDSSRRKIYQLSPPAPKQYSNILHFRAAEREDGLLLMKSVLSGLGSLIAH